MTVERREIWAEAALNENDVLQTRIGPLGIWLRQTNDEWDMAYKAVDEGDNNPDEYYRKRIAETDATKLEWRRWVAGEEERIVRFQPMMPDRPIVVKPETQINLLPMHNALFYVSIPVCVRISVGKNNALLDVIPTVVLSNTWFGDPTSGELCYSLFTRARRAVLKEQARPHRAVCPVNIENVSSEQLSFSRICLSVGHLSIFSGDNQLWTNEIKVSFESSDGTSRINYIQGAPKIAEVGRMLGEPRLPLTRGIIESGLRNLRIFG